MYFVSFDVDGRERTRRTNIFAGSTADTSGIVDGRNHWRFLVVLIEWNHLDSTRRTMAGTVAALHLVCQYHAVFLDPYSMTYLDRCLLVLVDRLDSSCRTNLRAAITLRAAIAMLVRHCRLHQMHKIAARTENLVWTL